MDITKCLNKFILSVPLFFLLFGCPFQFWDDEEEEEKQGGKLIITASSTLGTVDSSHPICIRSYDHYPSNSGDSGLINNELVTVNGGSITLDYFNDCYPLYINYYHDADGNASCGGTVEGYEVYGDVISIKDGKTVSIVLTVE